MQHCQILKRNFGHYFQLLHRLTMPFFSLHYLSHSSTQTGGYRHENFLANSLEQALKNKNIDVKLHKPHRSGYFKTMFEYLQLLIWGFKNANANVNIAVQRLALSAVLRNLLTQNKVLLVFHYFDPEDKKSIFLTFYFKVLLLVLAHLPLKNVRI